MTHEPRFCVREDNGRSVVLREHSQHVFQRAHVPVIRDLFTIGCNHNQFFKLYITYRHQIERVGKFPDVKQCVPAWKFLPRTGRRSSPSGDERSADPAASSAGSWWAFCPLSLCEH